MSPWWFHDGSDDGDRDCDLDEGDRDDGEDGDGVGSANDDDDHGMGVIVMTMVMTTLDNKNLLQKLKSLNSVFSEGEPFFCVLPPGDQDND